MNTNHESGTHTVERVHNTTHQRHSFARTQTQSQSQTQNRDAIKLKRSVCVCVRFPIWGFTAFNSKFVM